MKIDRSAIWPYLSLIIGYFLAAFALSAATHSASDPRWPSAHRFSGTALFRSLENQISSNHHPQSYGSLIKAFFKSDVDRYYDNDNSLLDIYSENPDRADNYVYRSTAQKCGNYKHEGDCFNREHIIPQSSFHKQYPMRTDFFHIYPSDGKVNSRRGHLAFGKVCQIKWESQNGSKVGKGCGEQSDKTVFEPIDEFKGDVARAVFYFVTRYRSRIPSMSFSMFSNDADHPLKRWAAQTLKDWHRNDPVGEYDRNRQEVGERHQGNRNPYIDHPEWVDDIF